MAKGINIPLNIQGLRQAKEDLSKLNEQIEKTQDVKQSQKLTKQYNDLSKAIDKTTDELLEMNKAGKLVGTKFDDLNEVLFDTQQEILPLTSQIGEMEDRMYQLAAAGDTSSQEFKALQTETVRLRKVIIETDKSVDLLAENQGLSVFAEGWSQVGNSILSLNFEQASKDADRLNSSIGSLGKIGASSIKNLIKTVGSLASTFIKFGAALLLNPLFLIPAIIAGIVAGIAFLIGGMDGVKKAFEFLFKPILDIINLLKTLTDWIGLTNFREQELQKARIARHKANMVRLKEEREELDKNRAANEKRAADEQRWAEGRINQLELEKRAAELNGGSIQDIDKKITAEKVKQLELQKDAFLQGQKDQLAQQRNTEAQLLSAYKNRTGDTAKIGKQLNDIRAKNARLEQQIAKDNFQALVEINQQLQAVELEAAEAEKERLKERADRYKEYANNRLAAARQIEDLELELMEEGLERDLTTLNLKYERLIEDTKSNETLRQEEKEKIIKSYEQLRANEEEKRIQESIDRAQKLEDELAKIIKDARNDELASIEQYQEDAYQLLLDDQTREEEALRAKYENQLAIVRAYGEDETKILEAQKKEQDAIDAKYALIQEQRKQALEDAKLGLTNEGLSLISSATELFGKKNEKNAKRAFEVNKAAQIAQAIISTYQGANAIFASAAANPATVLFPAQPFIAAGLAIGNGLINVAKIAQTKFEGGSVPSGGGGGSAPSIGGGGASSTQASSPNFNLFGQSNALNEAQSATSTETTQNIQVQAVVSETEITSTQQTVNNIQQNAEL